jgi:hypothetical protein
MFAIVLLLLLLGMAIGAALVLRFHHHGSVPYVSTDLDAMDAVDRLFEASARARHLMLQTRHDHGPHPRSPFGDETS